MLFWCWFYVCDGEPASKQHWFTYRLNRVLTLSGPLSLTHVCCPQQMVVLDSCRAYVFSSPEHFTWPYSIMKTQLLRILKSAVCPVLSTRPYLARSLFRRSLAKMATQILAWLLPVAVRRAHKITVSHCINIARHTAWLPLISDFFSAPDYSVQPSTHKGVLSNSSQCILLLVLSPSINVHFSWTV